VLKENEPMRTSEERCPTRSSTQDDNLTCSDIRPGHSCGVSVDDASGLPGPLIARFSVSPPMPAISPRTKLDLRPSCGRRSILSKHYARRDLLSLAAGGGALAAFGPRALAQGGAGLFHPTPRPEDFKLPAGAVMPKRKLGRAGEEVSLLGLGGFHIGKAKDDETATRIVRTAIDHGVTFLDNCWDYNEGKSHERMGKALRDGYRKKVFLMTKIDGRTRAAAAAQIDQSLRQLETDVIDLMQIHEVIRPEDPARVFGPNGAIEALVAARKAGKVRFIGFTGHKSPDIHLSMLAAARDHRFHYDAVQMTTMAWACWQ
jgi:Aldo/keto reductase family